MRTQAFRLLLLVAVSPMLPAADGTKCVFRSFNTRHGLSQDVVLSVMQDNAGFLWVGTQSGLNRFDGYQFKSYRYDPHTPGSISADEILSMLQDSKGHMWVGTQSGGLNLYDATTDTFRSWRSDPENPDALSFNAVQEIHEAPDGTLWLPTWGGGLNRFDPETGKAMNFRADPADPHALADDIIWDMCPGADGTWWLATNNGLCRFDPVTKTFQTYRHDPEDPGSLSDNRIVAVLMDRTGTLWVGTRDHGLNRMDPGQDRFIRYGAKPGDPWALQDLGINTVFEDSRGKLWIGTDRGLNSYDRMRDRFRAYIGDAMDPQAIGETSVWRIGEDRLGNMWLCTYQGLVTFRPDHATFGYYQRRGPAGTYLTDETYYAMDVRDNRYLWAATVKGLVRFDSRSETFDHWQPEGGAEESPSIGFLRFDASDRLWLTSGNRLMSFDEDTGFRTELEWHGNITEFAFGEKPSTFWLATYQGLLYYDLNDGSRRLFAADPDDPESLSHNAVIALTRDSRGRVWVGTYGAGLNLLKPDHSGFIHFTQDPDNLQTLANNAINCVREAPDGTIWVGTRGGLSRYDEASAGFKSYWKKHGLPNPFINDLLFDDAGFLWISTDNGIARMEPETETFVYFDAEDGLQGNVFSGGASTRFPDGRLVFGGDGFNLFDPTVVQPTQIDAPVVLTDLLLFNEPVALSTPGHPTPLTQPLTMLPTLALSYKEYVFAFRFAALDFSFSDKRTYEYRLEGLDTDWIPAYSGSRLANYTNLGGGTYTLHVRGKDKNGHLFAECSLRLIVHPPPWRTLPAYILYVTLVFLAVAGYVRAQRRKLAKEREIVQRLNEVDRLKDAFLANTSHELRTPLHGMIGLAEAVLDHSGDKLDDTANLNLEMIVSSGQRLSNLINDILDFSKLQHNSLQCTIQPVDLFGTVRVVLGLTAPLLGDKDLTLENEVDPDLTAVAADENRLQQILFNLVGNAVKFTEAGHIRVSAERVNDLVEVSVSDTGIGIPEEKCEDIFHAFRQADGSTAREYGGTGLGLAVTRKLVELQHGTIRVTSTPGRGSTFTFTVPIATEEAGAPAPEAIKQGARVGRTPRKTTGAVSGDDSAHRFRILVVDDDPVNRMVLINHLAHEYRVVAVESGSAAIQAVEDHQGFDLILLDVMMPKMTGFDVCRHLRTNFPSHELPVIYLTAKMHENDVVTGFETGANDYIIKPVSKGELLMRVETHLHLLDTNRNLEAKVEDRTRHLVNAQKELLREAHTAGMAEIAVDVMHNVGNRLNSLGTSVQLLEDLAVKDRKGLSLLERFTELVVQNKDDLETFLRTDPTVARLPEFLPKITRKMVAGHESMLAESRKLTTHLKAMAATLQAQQKHTGLSGVMSTEHINDLLEAVLQMGAFSVQESKGTLVTHFAPDLPPLHVNRVRLMRVLICLFQNAIEAIGRRSDGTPGTIELETFARDDKIGIRIEDNGEGISPEDLVRVFAYGFTTRPGKQGFGLHYCANTLREMGGDIRVDSPGTGRGTRAVVLLPRT